jgi:hypothetical protein
MVMSLRSEESLFYYILKRLLSKFISSNLSKKDSSMKPKLIAQGFDFIDQANDRMDRRPIHAMFLAERFDVTQPENGFFVEMPFFLLAVSWLDDAFAAVENDFPARTSCHADDDFQRMEVVGIGFYHFHINAPVV